MPTPRARPPHRPPRPYHVPRGPPRARSSRRRRSRREFRADRLRRSVPDDPVDPPVRPPRASAELTTNKVFRKVDSLGGVRHRRRAPSSPLFRISSHTTTSAARPPSRRSEPRSSCGCVARATASRVDHCSIRYSLDVAAPLMARRAPAPPSWVGPANTCTRDTRDAKLVEGSREDDDEITTDGWRARAQPLNGWTVNPECSATN